MSQLFKIKEVAQRTGLSEHVIRVWERRYHTVEPVRIGKIRHYCESDITRLILLRQATEDGHDIGKVARLPDNDLRRLVGGGDGEEVVVDNFFAACRKLDLDDAIRVLTQAAISRTLVDFAQQVGLRAAQQILGERDRIVANVAHQALEMTLIRLVATIVPPPSAPLLLVGSPLGKTGELGNLLLSKLALLSGWRRTNIGYDLTGLDFARAVGLTKPDALAIVLLNHYDDAIEQELVALAPLLPKRFPVLLGGPAAADSPTVKAQRWRVFPDYVAFSPELAKLARR